MFGTKLVILLQEERVPAEKSSYVAGAYCFYGYSDKSVGKSLFTNRKKT